MKKLVISAAVVVSAMCMALPAQAKGCLKGAAVGGVAGHVAGHHGVIGAAAGCAIGHHRANKQDKAAAQSQTTAAPAPAGTPAVSR